MLLQTVIKKDHDEVQFSESSVSQIYFELVSISKNQSLNFLGFTV